MDTGLDTGDKLLVERTVIAPDETTGSLQDKLADLGGRLAVEAVKLAQDGGLKPVHQPETGVTYARKIDKSEAAIDWSRPALEIERRVRAFDPAPGASSVVNGESLKVWRCQLVPASSGDAQPGTVLQVDPAGVVVASGEGALRVTQLQRPGGKRLPTAEFLRGFAIAAGMVFERPAT